MRSDFEDPLRLGLLTLGILLLYWLMMAFSTSLTLHIQSISKYILLLTNESQIHSLLSTSTATTLVQVTIICNPAPAVLLALSASLAFFFCLTVVPELRLLEEGYMTDKVYPELA